MSDPNEMIADIVAEMRKDVASAKAWQASIALSVISRFADRIEAAWKRERAATIEKSSAVGNAAKLREALKLCGSQMCKLCKDLTLARSMINKGLMGVSCHPDKCKPFQAVHEALAAPPRNCDVGTIDDQVNRLNAFCASHGTVNGAPRCEKCHFRRKDRCELFWAQMPYEESEDGK